MQGVVGSRNLISNSLRERLVKRIEKDESILREMAERVINAALSFLDLCAKNPGRRFSPSPLVDIGWHTFILYTREYTEFCYHHAGRFIHHEPNDNPEVPMESGGTVATVAFMREKGIVFDAKIWALALTGNCSADCDGGKGPDRNCACS